MRPWARIVHVAACSAAAHPGARRRVLVSTLAPGNGGVHAMTSFVVQTLAQRGLEPVIAHYAPYSIKPTLSVPAYRLLQRRVSWQAGTGFGGHESNAIGAWLPELEFTHYAATRRWRDLIDSCDAHIAVSGNVLAATAYWQRQRPYLAWVATDWEGDRKDRVRAFPAARRLLDRAINRPVIRRLERNLLRGGYVLPLSQYTSRMLSQIAQRPPDGPILPVGVDTTLFVPHPAAVVQGRIGFAGRFSDPRKNVGLLLSAVARLRDRGLPVSCMLVGDTAPADIVRAVRELRIEPVVQFVATVPKAMLPAQYQAMDVFVLPSHQEGLCIAALEAMASGVPVVSTRCGGPEEFVIDGETGFLCDADPDAVAALVRRIIEDRGLRDTLGRNARRLVQERYSRGHAEQVFWSSFSSIFPDLAAATAKPS